MTEPAVNEPVVNEPAERARRIAALSPAEREAGAPSFGSVIAAFAEMAAAAEDRRAGIPAPLAADERPALSVIRRFAAFAR